MKPQITLTTLGVRDLDWPLAFQEKGRAQPPGDASRCFGVAQEIAG